MGKSLLFKLMRKEKDIILIRMDKDKKFNKNIVKNKLTLMKMVIVNIADNKS